MAQELTPAERDTLSAVLKASMAKLTAAIQGLDSTQLHAKPNAKNWSIAECLEHMALAERQFPAIVAAEVQKPSQPQLRKRLRFTDEDIRPRMTSRRWKANSPEIFKPSGQFASATVAYQAIIEQRNATIVYVNSTTNDLRNHFWRHPLTGQIDLYQTLLLMSAHMERHTEQIENIKRALAAAAQ